MKQPHREQTVRHTDDQQNTGTHKQPDAPDAKGADRFGGTRTGKQNIEPGADRTPHADRKPDAVRRLQ